MNGAVLKYKNYQGSIEYDEESETLHGKVLHVRDLITYEAETAKELEEGVSRFGERLPGNVRGGRNRAEQALERFIQRASGSGTS